MIKLFPWLLLFSVLAASCQKKSGEEAALSAKTEFDVAYGSHPQQKMDIYLPANRTISNTKTIIFIHGGGWSGGDKSDFTPFVDSVMKRLPGWAVININYRLVNGSSNLFPTQELDVKEALQFVYDRIREYQISDKFVLLGGSAGGHLACLVGYKYDSPVKVKAVVDFFGPTDLVDLYRNPPIDEIRILLNDVIGGTPEEKPEIYQTSSPINFVSGQTPPTIILQGGVDILVPARQSEALKNKLNAAGVANQYVLYPNENHGWDGAELTDSFNKIAEFISAHVK